MRLKAENALAGSAERKDQALALIVEQVERLDGVLRRLLSVTEHDRPRRERTALGSFLEGCRAAHTERASAKGVALECLADGSSAAFDPEQMRRALDNLVLNAIEAAPAGTCVRVAARRERQELIFSVHDEGAGPPAAIREHLFEPFVIGRANGTGLGLSIVREVAAAHGGTAHLAETPSGTTFEITLPWQEF